MAYRNSTEAYDLAYFQTRSAAPKQLPKEAPMLQPKAAPSKKAQKKKAIREEARLRAVFRMEIIGVTVVLLSLIGAVLYGKVQTAEDVILIGERQQVLSTLISEQTRLSTELEQLLPARTVEAYVTKYLGMSTINEYQKNYMDTNSGEKVEILKESPKLAVVDFVQKSINPEQGLVYTSGA